MTSLTSSDWPPYKVQQSERRLAELHATLSDAMEHEESDSDADLSSYLAKLLVVRSSGHLEVVSSSCLLAFFERHSEPVAANYIQTTYRTWKSPKPEDLKSTLAHMAPAAKEDFSSFLKNDKDGIDLSSEIGSMVSERGKISHGENDSITPNKALRYYISTMKLSKWFVEYFEPNGKADARASAFTSV